MINNRLDDDNPVFLVIAEPGSLFSGFVCDFLKSNSLNVELLELDQDFFLNYKTHSKQQKNIYKIIFIYGFQSVSSGVFLKAMDFLDLQNQNQTTKVPLILISTISTSLEILDELDFGYQSFLNKKTTFLECFLDKFAESMVFLGQDVLSKDKTISYPLLLFFSMLKKGYIFDLQSNFFFQDERSFFNLIKEYLIKPHHANKFIIRGSRVSSEKISQKITYLYEQYFQKKLSIIKLFTNEKKQALIQEFGVVNNSQSQVENLIDKKIRGLVDSDNDNQLPSPSEQELQKAIEISRLQKTLQIKKLKAQNKLKKESSYPSLELAKQAVKEPIEDLPATNFSSEFIDKIESLFSIQRYRDKKTRQARNVAQGSVIIVKSKKRKILFGLGVLVFSISFLFLSLFAVFNLSQKSLKKSLYGAARNDLKEIKKIDKSINYWFFSIQMRQYKKLFSTETLSEAIDTETLSRVMLDYYASTEELEKLAYGLYRKTLDGGVDMNQFYDQLLSAIDRKIESQKDFNTYLLNLNLDLYQGEEKEVWQSNLEKTKAELKSALQLKRFFVAFKEFVFQAGRANVLVLIQDSNELRSTGGFLTEAIMLGFSNAVLVDRQVFNISDLDSRVYGRKESSQDIKEQLGEENLFLHDSNWQADFAKSSQEVQWFVEQATGFKIDLTIALNSKTIREIVAVLGDIKLENELVINSENYLEKIEASFLNDYKTSNNQKISWQLTNALLDKSTGLSQDQLSNFSEVLLTQLNQRELLFQSNNQSLQQVIEANSWGGTKTALICPVEFNQANCLLDFIFQVESNVGINKINSHIKETIEHSLGISKNFIRHKRKITFENLAESGSWPLGSYRNYLRFYLNYQANLEKIELDEQKINLDKVKITESEEGKEISLLVEIPQQSKVVLTLTYLVPNQVSSPFSYVFFDQKQAGVFNKKTNYKIVFDEQFKPQLIAPQATYQNKTIYFKNENLDHFLFAISFDQ